MWFSEKALVFVDTRTAALAVYRQTLRGPRLLRFGHERFESRAGQGSLFSELLADSKDAVARLVRGLSAPLSGGSVLLPLGVTFPSIVETASLRRSGNADVEEAELLRFRLAPLLPFPVAQAEVRTESGPSIGQGIVLAQAVPKAIVEETDRAMRDLGFGAPLIASALSASLRGLSARPGTVDLILGDSASAIAVRDERGSIQAVHVRLLVEGDDRASRSIDEAIRATPRAREIRVIGEEAALIKKGNGETPIVPAYDERAPRDANAQRFPFLGVFEERAGR
jgi:hypothetical protein